MGAIQQRNITADVLKGLAVIFMIQVHIMEQFASVEVNNSIIGRIFYFLGGPFCAPVFLAVMGYFLAKTKPSFWNYLKRGFLLITVGILLNIARSIHLLITVFQGKYDLDPLFYIFGADILTLAGLSIIILAGLHLISKDNLFLYIPVLFVFASLGSFVNIIPNSQNFFLAFVIGNFEHSYFPLFPWFSYVLLGYIFKIIFNKHQILISRFTYLHWIFIGLLSIVILYFSKDIFAISSNLPVYYHHDYMFVLWMTGFMILYVLLINQISKVLQNNMIFEFFSWTGKNVTIIYIIQWLIIGNIATAIYQTQDLLKSELWFIGITATSGILTFIYLKIIKYFKNKNEISF